MHVERARTCGSSTKEDKKLLVIFKRKLIPRIFGTKRNTESNKYE